MHFYLAAFKRHYALRLAIAPEFFYCSYMCLFYVCALSCWNKICICVYVDSTIIDYSAPDRGAEYWDERVYDSVYGVIIMTKVIARVHPVHYVQVTRFKCVCLSVCPYVCLPRSYQFSGTTHPILTKFFVYVTHGRGSVLLRRRIDMLRISGVVDDVIFAQS